MSIPTPPDQSGVELQAKFCVAIDHPCLAGHFPGRPVVPAVVLLDLVTTELLSQLQTHSTTIVHQQWRLLRIAAARFQSPWLPNEQLATTLRIDMNTHRAQLQALVGERAVATATLHLGLVDARSGTAPS